jgi:hypothetical protein
MHPMLRTEGWVGRLPIPVTTYPSTDDATPELIERVIVGLKQWDATEPEGQ